MLFCTNFSKHLLSCDKTENKTGKSKEHNQETITYCHLIISQALGQVDNTLIMSQNGKGIGFVRQPIWNWFI